MANYITVAGSVGRVLREPIYDRELVKLGDTCVFFRNRVGDRRGDGQVKTHADTNMFMSGSLPKGYCFYLVGFALWAEEEWARAALRDTYSIHGQVGTYIYDRLPAISCLHPLNGERFHDVRVLGRPRLIEDQECFDFRLYSSPESKHEPFLARFHLLGYQYRGEYGDKPVDLSDEIARAEAARPVVARSAPRVELEDVGAGKEKRLRCLKCQYEFGLTNGTDGWHGRCGDRSRLIVEQWDEQRVCLFMGCSRCLMAIRVEKFAGGREQVWCSKCDAFVFGPAGVQTQRSIPDTRSAPREIPDTRSAIPDTRSSLYRSRVALHVEDDSAPPNGVGYDYTAARAAHGVSFKDSLAEWNPAPAVASPSRTPQDGLENSQGVSEAESEGAP